MNPKWLAAPVAALAVAWAAAAQAQAVVRLPAQDRALAVRPQTVFQVGKEDGQAWEVFSDVPQVAFDRNENLYVLDRGNARVVVFDRAGRFVRQVGRRGGGPGEFTSPWRLAIAADGSLVVSDNGRRAFSIFAPDGRFVRSVPHDPSFGVSGVNLQPHPRGGVVTGAQPLPAPGRAARGNSVVWYPLAAGGTPSRLFEAPSAAGTAPRNVPGGGSIVSFRPAAFSPVLRWGVLPDGALVSSHTDTYSLQVRASGGASRVLERPIRPRAVTQRDRDAELARRAEHSQGSGSVTLGGNAPLSPQARRAMAEHSATAEFASTIPVIQDLEVDRSGRIWVQRSGVVAGRPGPVDLLSADGRYLGTLPAQALPDAFSPAGRAAYIVEDEMGVQKVVVRSFPGLAR